MTQQPDSEEMIAMLRRNSTARMDDLDQTILDLRAEYAELARRVGVIETDINLIRSELGRHVEMLMAHEDRLTALESWRQTMTGDGR